MIVFKEKDSDWESLVDSLAGGGGAYCIRSFEIFSKTGSYVLVTLGGKGRLNIISGGSGFQLEMPPHRFMILRDSVRRIRINPTGGWDIILTNGDSWAIHTR
jgi:hypothetical protein